MMYNNKLAIAVKSNGKVLREVKDTVYVPFGTEYSLLVKNLRAVRASVRISIDNVDVADGGSLIIPANGELELERFIKNGNMDKGNRFKFIERTAKIEENRGIGITDGLIRVEFQFEKQAVLLDKPKEVHHFYHYDYRPWYWDRMWCGGITYGYGHSTLIGNADVHTLVQEDKMYATSENLQAKYTAGEAQINNLSMRALDSASLSASATSSVGQNTIMRNAVLNETGITVPGSVSEQKFATASHFELENEKFEIVLRMLGETAEGKQIIAPVTVKSKQKCSTCGKTNKASAKFCGDCGTALEIV